MIKYVNKLKVENISEFCYIMRFLYDYFLKKIFNKPHKRSFNKGLFKKYF